MLLNNKTMIAIMAPFVVYGTVFLNTSFFTPLLDDQIKSYAKDVNAKTFSYKKEYDYIDRNLKNFSTIFNKTKEDKIVLWKNAVSIFIPEEKKAVDEVNTITKFPPLPPLTDLAALNATATEPVKKADEYKIQMTIPEDGMAIINNQIYYIGDENNGIILTRVDKKQACIKTQKGSQCIKIF